MNVIIAGGRDFSDYARVLDAMDDFYFAGEIVSGGANGADALGERWAADHDRDIKRFPADWSKYGKSAGPIRNLEMALYADVLVAFWDGKSRGTKHMIDTALKHGLEVHVYRYGG